MPLLLTLLWFALVPLAAPPLQPCVGAGSATAASEVVATSHVTGGPTDRSSDTPRPSLTRGTLDAAGHALRSASIQSRVPLVRIAPRDPGRLAPRRSDALDPAMDGPRGVAAGARTRPDVRHYVVAAHGSRPPYLPTAPPLHG